MKKFYRLIGIIILIIILAKIDLQKMVTYFSRLNLVFFFFINLLTIPSLLLKSYRWKYLLKLQGFDYSLQDTFVSYLCGISAGIVTPARVGEAVKAVYLKQDLGIPLSKGLASVFLDRLFDLYILALLGYLGIWHFLIKNIPFGLLVFFSVFLIFPVFFLMNKPMLERITKTIYKLLISGMDKSFFESQVGDFFGSLKKIFMQRISLPIIFTFLAYIVFLWQSYLLARLACINISFITVVFFVSIANLISLLPITILGMGTREASLIYLFSLVGLNAESAVAYSVILFFSFYVVTGFLAYIGWFIKTRT